MQPRKKYPTPLFGAMLTPAPELTGLVRYWHLSTGCKILKPGLKMLPDEHMDIIFDFKSARGKGSMRLWGIQLGVRLLKMTNPVEFVGIKFVPGSFYSLFGRPAHLFSGKVLTLKSAIGQNAEYFNGIFALKTHEARVNFINSILVMFAKKRIPMEPKITRALKNIYIREGKITVDVLAKNAGWSEFWFSEVFKKWVGITPQQFCKHIKFKHTMRKLQSGHSFTDVISDLDYADQAHFINFFKHYTGLTPKNFTKKYIEMHSRK